MAMDTDGLPPWVSRRPGGKELVDFELDGLMCGKVCLGHEASAQRPNSQNDT